MPVGAKTATCVNNWNCNVCGW